MKTETKNNDLPKGAIMAMEVAEKEIETWFDYRKTKETARDVINEDIGYDYSRRTIVEGFMYGMLTFDKTIGVLTQKLEYPLSNESGDFGLKELKFQPRLKRNALIEPMRGVKASNSEGKVEAWISAATGTTKSLLGKMDVSDYGLAEIIITYFLK